MKSKNKSKKYTKQELRELKIIKRNLVYVIGLPKEISNVQIL